MLATELYSSLLLNRKSTIPWTKYTTSDISMDEAGWALEQQSISLKERLTPQLQSNYWVLIQEEPKFIDINDLPASYRPLPPKATTPPAVIVNQRPQNH